jgi:hypothetical protein
MLRHSWAFAVSLIIVFGFTGSTPAQTALTGSPSTAYQQNGKWVGYVPPHQRNSQPASSRLFGSSLPDITSCLAGKSDGAVKTASAVEPIKVESEKAFAGTLLGSERRVKEPRVLAVAYDEPTPVFDPVAGGGPVFNPSAGMTGEGCSTGCDPCCAAPDARCMPARFYGSAEYLLWWIDGMGTPPLVTTSPAGTVQNEAGVLGRPGTTILFGGSDLEGNAISGGRFSLGMWLDPCHSQGLEASYFTLGTETTSYGASGADYAILARPIYNTVDARQDARLLVYNNLVSGSVLATASTHFDGGEFLFRQALQRECWAEIDLVVGYRWLQLEDGLLIEESTQSLVAAAAGTSFDLYDRFDTRNSFHGGELGMSLRGQLSCCWSLELLAKIGIGNMKSAATIDGQTTAISPTGTAVSEGGLLALPTNMGRYERDKLATATEVGLKLRRSFCDGIDLTIGYTFLYLSDVLRAGEQIDTNINVSQLSGGALAGAPFPEFNFQSNGFWAQGISFGIEGRF